MGADKRVLFYQMEDLEMHSADIKATESSSEPTSADKNMDSGAGLRAWMTVCGSWLTLFATLGNIYSFGVYQDFYTRIFLASFSPSSIGWMGSLQLMLPFAVSLMSGRCLDAGYFHHVVLLGSIIFLLSAFTLSLANEGKYYQVFLSQGLGIGIGAGLIFAPASSVVTLHFQNRPHRHLAYGLALSGISFGAVVFPIVLNHMLPLVGFANATRNAAYISLGCLVPGNLLMRVPRTPKAAPARSCSSIRSFFQDRAYCVFILGATLSTLAVYFPAVYLQLYAIEQNIDSSLAFYSVAIVNGSGIVGRILANHLADIYGLWNLQLASTLVAGVSIWTVLVITNKSALIAVAIFYGLCSGAWFSLAMAALASLSPNSHEIGARSGVAMAITSIGLLFSIPLQGALLTSGFLWIRSIAFTGSVMFVAAILSAYVRVIVSRRKGSQRV